MRIATVRTAPVLGLAAFALAACAPNARDGDPVAGSPAAPPPATESCDATRVQSFVGQTASDDVVERARAGAGASTARTLKPGQAVTMEYLEGRLNIHVDESEVITELHCG